MVCSVRRGIFVASHVVECLNMFIHLIYLIYFIILHIHVSGHSSVTSISLYLTKLWNLVILRPVIVCSESCYHIFHWGQYWLLSALRYFGSNWCLVLFLWGSLNVHYLPFNLKFISHVVFYYILPNFTILA